MPDTPHPSGQPSGAPGAHSMTGIPAANEVIADKYVVERVLGVGGMGVVLAARHLQLGRRVAIKFMRSEAASNPNAVGRFLREAKAAVALSSEHAAKVLDVGTLDTGEPYMVMEFLSGTDLGELLRREGRLPIVDAVGFVLQACEALAEAHSIGIVHRDLKPANLFVTQRMDGKPLVKVLDFGISKMAGTDGSSSSANLTSTGLVMGSPGYMSPEQVRNSKNVDARSDVWALGVVLYEILSGISPFRGETIGETFARIVTETPPPVSIQRPDVPRALATAVAQCLERDVAQRVQSVQGLAIRLLPFGPPEAKASVDRILGLSRGSAGINEAASGTMMAPASMTSDAHSPDRLHDSHTGPGWLESSAVAKSAAARPRSRAFVVPLAVVGAVVGLLAALGLFVRHAISTGPVAVTASSSVTAAKPVPVAPTPTEIPILTLTPAPSAARAVDPPGEGDLGAAVDAGAPPKRMTPVRHSTPVASPSPPPAAPAPPPKADPAHPGDNVFDLRQ